jgi:hypothetical protein
MSFKHILVTGSANESCVRFLLEKVFQVNNYSSEIREYILEGIKIVVLMNLNESNLVNLGETNARIRTSLTSIICIENNDTPDTLQTSMNFLSVFFTASELNMYLKILFVYQNMNSDRLPQLRLDMRTNDMLFDDFLQISNENLKWTFITQNIWIIHENYIQQLRDQFGHHSHTLDTKKIFAALGVVLILFFIVIGKKQ